MLLPMAREEKKQVVLRPVDDEVLPVGEVVRLENTETGRKTKREEPVRLGAKEAVQPPSRLDLPSREEVELRTHQPGIDVLINPATVEMELTEDTWGEAAVRKNPVPWGWFALVGLALAGALAWSLTNLKESETQAGQIRENTRSVLASEEDEKKAARELVERIEVALNKYFTTLTVESLARQVRQPERVLPLMRTYYARQPLKANSIASVRTLQPVTLDNRANFWVAAVTLFDGRTSNLFIEIDPSGNPLIDWETQICHQPMPWDEFARNRPEGSSLGFRVYVEKDSFFSHEFSDAGGWLCFRLTTLGAEESMFGYVRADSEEARKLLDLVQNKGRGKASLILRLSIPERLQSRQGVVIEKVLSTRWVYLDPPEDAS